MQAYVDGASAELTPIEFRLVYTLAREQGRVLTRDELLQRVWAGGRPIAIAPSTSSSASCARRSIVARRPTFIHTRYGVGYKLEAEPK